VSFCYCSGMTNPSRTPQETKKLKKLGSYIRQWRERKNLTQEQLAPLAGFTRSYITDIETGRRNISFLNLMKIFNALEIDDADWKKLIDEITENKA
jgi:transcriptional regulator with XRE-family HTH domain